MALGGTKGRKGKKLGPLRVDKREKERREEKRGGWVLGVGRDSAEEEKKRSLFLASSHYFPHHLAFEFGNV